VDHQLIMPRTTIDIDAPILRDLKRRQKREGKSLGRLVSDLLAQALHQSKVDQVSSSSFRWISRSMRAQIDLADKDAVHGMLDRQDGRRTEQR
jgi:hypothetical protein